MRFAFADPPYLGMGVKYYNDHPDAAHYDTIDGHKRLATRLATDYPDGWALCMGSVDLTRLLPVLLPILPDDIRIAAWCKPFASFKPNVNPAYTWEPVVFRGGRRGDRTRLTVKDHLAEPITLRRGLTGAKPDVFCRWVLDLLGFVPGDVMDDLFPGTCGMGRAVARAGAEIPITNHAPEQLATVTQETP